MSMLGNPKDDGIHWPMILNVPGEGFGDDFLQTYSNHSLLTDDDDDLFLLDEAMERIGGMCNSMDMGAGGPPAEGEVQPHIPSNLEVDPNAWFSNVYTYSPVWQPPMRLGDDLNNNAKSGRAVTEEGSVIISSCYDVNAKAVDISVEFLGVQKEDGSELPWMALGYRETEECRMNPRGGGDSEMILLTTGEGDEDDSMNAYYTMLPSAARSFDVDAFSAISNTMIPLNEREGYSNIALHLPSPVSTMARSSHAGAEDSVVLHFQQSMDASPDVMHLMYAIGSSAQVGYHLSRECLDITKFPTCPTANADTSSNVADTAGTSSGRSSSFVSVAGIIAMTSTMIAILL